MFKLFTTVAVAAGILTSKDPHELVRYGDAETVALALHRQEYNPLKRDDNGDTGFHAASFSPEVMQALTQPKNVKAWARALLLKNSAGFTPVDLAFESTREALRERISYVDPRIRLSDASPETLHGALHQLASDQ